MSKKPPKVLLTGFGPFPGVPVNASALLVSELARIATLELPGVNVAAGILPTDWCEAPARLHDLLDQQRPDIALHFGVSRKALGFEIETRALNTTCDKPDVARQLAVSDCLIEFDADELAATIDTGAIAACLQDIKIPAVVSDDAGAYLCNAILYHSLAFARDHNLSMRAGFIHLPDTLATQTECGSRLNWSSALAGGIAILACCLRR